MKKTKLLASLGAIAVLSGSTAIAATGCSSDNLKIHVPSSIEVSKSHAMEIEVGLSIGDNTDIQLKKLTATVNEKESETKDAIKVHVFSPTQNKVTVVGQKEGNAIFTIKAIDVNGHVALANISVKVTDKTPTENSDVTITPSGTGWIYNEYVLALNYEHTTGSDINLTVTLDPAPASAINDLKLMQIDGSGTPIVATSTSASSYTFTISQDAITSGEYKISGTNVNDLYFAITVTPYIVKSDVVITAPTGGDHYSWTSGTLGLDFDASSGNSITVKATLNPVQPTKVSDLAIWNADGSGSAIVTATESKGTYTFTIGKDVLTDGGSYMITGTNVNELTFTVSITPYVPKSDVVITSSGKGWTYSGSTLNLDFMQTSGKDIDVTATLNPDPGSQVTDLKLVPVSAGSPIMPSYDSGTSEYTFSFTNSFTTGQYMITGTGVNDLTFNVNVTPYVPKSDITINAPGANDHYTWSSNTLGLDFSIAASGSAGSDIAVKATLNPAATISDLAIWNADGSGSAIVTATQSSGTYTFTINKDALTSGSYKITGTNVNELTFTVNVTPYEKSTVTIDSSGKGWTYSSGTLNLDYTATKGANIDVTVSLKPQPTSALNDLKLVAKKSGTTITATSQSASDYTFSIPSSFKSDACKITGTNVNELSLSVKVTEYVKSTVTIITGEHYTWSNNVLDLDYSIGASGSAGANIVVKAKLDPAITISDLAIEESGGGTVVTATESSGIYTFNIGKDTLKDGSYKITGTDVEDLAFTVNVTPYKASDVTIVSPTASDHYTWSNNTLGLNFSIGAGGSAGSDIAVRATLSPAPTTALTDLKIVPAAGGAAICTAQSQSASNYTFSIPKSITAGSYKITGTNVDDLTFTVNVTPYQASVVTITAPSAGDHYTWSNNTLGLDFSIGSGGSAGSDIAVKATLNPAPATALTDLKIVPAAGGAAICTAQSQSASNYTFSIPKSITAGSYKITGTNVTDLTFTVNVTEYVKSSVTITPTGTGWSYSNSTLALDYATTKGANIDVTASLNPVPGTALTDLKLVTDGGVTICTATSQSASGYTFSIPSTIAAGSYKITGSNVTDLAFAVTVNPYVKSTVTITSSGKGWTYSNNTLALDYMQTSGNKIDVTATLNPSITISDLAIVPASGGSAIVTASEAGGTYTFSINEDDLTDGGSYKITGTDVNDLTFTVTVNPYVVVPTIVGAVAGDTGFGTMEAGTAVVSGTPIEGTITTNQVLDIETQNGICNSVSIKSKVIDKTEQTWTEGAAEAGDFEFDTSTTNHVKVKFHTSDTDKLNASDTITITLTFNGGYTDTFIIKTPAMEVVGSSTNGFGGERVLTNGMTLSQLPAASEVLVLTIKNCYTLGDISISNTKIFNSKGEQALFWTGAPIEYQQPGDFEATLSGNEVTITITSKGPGDKMVNGETYTIKLHNKDTMGGWDIATFVFKTPNA